MFQERKCVRCGKTIIRPSFGSYLYKRVNPKTGKTVVYCGWNCYNKKTNEIPLSNPCVCCGKEIPEGWQVCKDCEFIARKNKK